MQKVLIANRGEIAVRIARGCAAYGIGSVAVYSEPDVDALHVRTADEAYALPGARPSETYLDVAALLSVARRSGADAVHPGYGFLSENADFAEAVIDAGLTWIGPDPETMRILGDKVAARRLAASVNAPLVAGTPGPVRSGEDALRFAQEHGLPIAIKASRGGGGRGLRVAWRMDEVAEQFGSAVREAVAAFGDGECYLEEFLPRPRHVEAQIIGDRHGHLVVVGTRDCSLQRRNQKVVEEAPAPFLTGQQRQRIEDSARRICEAARYVNAGTVEFLLGRNGAISFLEVNTRLQVEHPVTEAACNIDLVRQQLRVADGLPLEIDGTPAAHGHAIEFRINAEDPGRGFLPVPGRLTRFDAPGGEGVRLDSGVEAGSSVSRYYDSLLAKLVVHGRDRGEALRKARQAISEFEIEGVPTLLPFHRRLLDEPAFTADRADGFAVHTRWIEEDCEWIDELTQSLGDREEPGSLVRSWIEVDGRRMRLGLPAVLLKALPGPRGGDEREAGSASAVSDDSGAGEAGAGEGTGSSLTSITAPVAGTIVKWTAGDGVTVKAGDTVAVMEAMKMETAVVAPASGTLRVLAPADGAYLPGGSVIGRIGRS